MEDLFHGSVDLKALRHPNVVQVLDHMIGEDDQVDYRGGFILRGLEAAANMLESHRKLMSCSLDGRISPPHPPSIFHCMPHRHLPEKVVHLRKWLCSADDSCH